MRPEQVLPFWVRVDLGVKAMKQYSTLHRPTELEPHHEIQFSVIPGTPFLERGLVPLQCI